MAGIGIISNPHSKANKGNSSRQDVFSYLLGQRGKAVSTKNLLELKQAAINFRSQDIDILAINGGDGTISCTISAFIHAYEDKKLPAIALLRGGTINTLAGNLNIKGSPEQNLFKLVERYSSKKRIKTIKLGTLSVGSQYGFIFASGSVANFLQLFYKQKTNALGSLALIFKLAASRFLYKPFYNKTIKSTRAKTCQS